MMISNRLFLVFCLLASGLCPAEEWNIGFRNTHVFDPMAKSSIEVGLWYPTKAQPRQETIGESVLNIALASEFITSLKGLVVISHGFSGNFLGHRDTAQYLAGQGYLVATPTHPDLPGLQSGNPELDPLVARPRHVQLTINELLYKSGFKNSLQGKPIGLVGFSLGAYTALVALGANPDVSRLDAYCKDKAMDMLLCSAQAKQRFSSIATHLISQPSAEIRGAVLLAPAYGPLFSDTSLENIEAPIRLFCAEQDRELDNRYNVEHFEKHIPNAAPTEVIKDAGLFVFMAPCPEALRQAVPYICEDAESVDRVEVHQKMNKDIAQFFDSSMNQRTRASKN